MSKSHFDKIAKELGYIAIHWAWIEDGIDQFLIELVELDEADLGDVITGNADLRSKIMMLKAVGFLRKTADDWFEELEKTLNYINDDLRPRRNTFMHSAWFRPHRRIVRRARKTKFRRPQSRQVVLMAAEEVQIRPADLRKLHR